MIRPDIMMLVLGSSIIATLCIVTVQRCRHAGKIDAPFADICGRLGKKMGIRLNLFIKG
jgi:hypothetical protein